MAKNVDDFLCGLKDIKRLYSCDSSMERGKKIEREYKKNIVFNRIINYFASLCSFRYAIVPKIDITKNSNSESEKLALHGMSQKIKGLNLGVIGRQVILKCLLFGYCILRMKNESAIELKSNAVDDTNFWHVIGSDGTLRFFESLDNNHMDCNPFLSVLEQLESDKLFDTLRIDSSTASVLRMIYQKIPVNERGEISIETETLKNLKNDMESAIPDGVTSFMGVGDVNHVQFSDRSENMEDSTNALKSVHVPLSIFGNDKNEDAILNAIRKDQEFIFNFIVKPFETFLNTTMFKDSAYKISILNLSQFNLDAFITQTLSGVRFGIPVLHRLAAAYDMDIADLDNMAHIEGDIFDFAERLRPLTNSNTVSN